jgi:Rieske Fe-S protein
MAEHSSSSLEKDPTRRGFFGILTWLVGALAALAVLVPFGAYLFGPLLRKREPKWIKLGAVGDFDVGETRLVTFVNPLGVEWDGMSANTGVYVRNLGGSFWVFAANCAHLNCPVSWFPQSGLFMCPCHGGVYYEDGERASGPPPRGLYHCVWRVKDNELEIQAPHLPTLHDTLKTPG